MLSFNKGKLDKAFDTKHHQERYRKVLLTVGSSILSKCMSMILIFLSINLTVVYLGVERFGIWMLVSGFVAMLSFLDLGIGNALTNHVAQRAALDNKSLLRDTISGGLAILAIVSIIIGTTFFILGAWIPWDYFFKHKAELFISEVRMTAIIFGILFGLNIFTSGLQRIFFGLQQGYLANLVTSFSTLVACLALWLATNLQQGIPMLLLSVLGIQSGLNLILLVILTFRDEFSLRNIRKYMACEFPFLYKNSSYFLILQLGTMVGWGADNVIISGVLGVAQVAIFSVVQRLFQFVSQPLAIINNPLWGAYADALARGDKSFIKKTLKKSLIITFFLAFSLSLILIVFHSWIIEKWTHNEVLIDPDLIIAVGAWTILDATGNAFAAFLNGTGIIQRQIIVVCSFIAILLPLKFLFTYHFGLIGIPVSTILVYIITTTFFYGFIFLPEIKKRCAG